VFLIGEFKPVVERCEETLGVRFTDDQRWCEEQRGLLA
jgi:hypothetical protein